MPNFYLKDDSNFKYKVGSDSDGINGLPIFNALKVYKFDLMGGGSATISSHQTSDIYQTFYPQSGSLGEYHPIAIVGIDVSMAYYCNIAKFYMEYNNDGSAKVSVRIANAGSGSYTVSRLYAHVLCALRTNTQYLTSISGSMDGGEV